MKDWWHGILHIDTPTFAHPWLDSLPKPARDALVAWLALEIINGDKTPDDVSEMCRSLGCPEDAAESSGNWLFLTGSLSKEIKRRAGE